MSDWLDWVLLVSFIVVLIGVPALTVVEVMTLMQMRHEDARRCACRATILPTGLIRDHDSGLLHGESGCAPHREALR